MPHQLRPTDQITLEGRTFELETTNHHQNQTYAEYEEDCPEGWEIPEYWLLPRISNSPDRDKFNLLNTWEFVQTPDALFKEMGYVSRFYANSGEVCLDCDRNRGVHNVSLGGRYVREISQVETS